MVMSHHKTNKVRLIIIHCIAPLFIGGLLYIFFRSTDLRMFKWFSFIGVENLIHSLREKIFPLRKYLSEWTYYSLPDGLWVYSFTSALILWNGRLTFWFLLPLLSGAFVEIAQAFKIFPGTFDFLDLTFTSLAVPSSIIAINHKLKQNEK